MGVGHDSHGAMGERHRCEVVGHQKSALNMDMGIDETGEDVGDVVIQGFLTGRDLDYPAVLDLYFGIKNTLIINIDYMSKNVLHLIDSN